MGAGRGGAGRGGVGRGGAGGQPNYGVPAIPAPIPVLSSRLCSRTPPTRWRVYACPSPCCELFLLPGA
jgi:hypothetical protein